MDYSSFLIADRVIQEMCRRYRVRELAVFGSALREDFGDQSDVDLLVEFEPDVQMGFIGFSKLRRELSAHLHRPVDLVPKGGLKPRIRNTVLSEARILYAA
jgi:predicted nucleotidyltransferase